MIGALLLALAGSAAASVVDSEPEPAKRTDRVAHLWLAKSPFSHQSASATTRVPALSSSEIEAELKTLDSNWKLTRNNTAISRTFLFKDFVLAFEWMTKVAQHAEAQGHHPEWFNVYNRVEVTLSTHDAGNALSSKDFELARTLDSLAK